MANLGRIEFTILNSSGLPVSGASIAIYRQGASCSGAQSGSPLNVDAINGIVAGDEIVNGTGTVQRTVSAVTATTVTCGVGFTVSDDDRLIPVTSQPTLYIDAQGNESTSSTLTTNSLGYAAAYVLGGMYDAKVSGGGLTAYIIQDVAALNAESSRSNAYTTGSLEVLILDTLRSMAAGDKLFVLKNAGTEKFSVAGDGDVVLPKDLTVAGLTTTATAAITSTSTIGGTVTQTAGNYAQTGVSSAITQTGSLSGNTFSQPTTCTGNLTVSGAGKVLTVSADSGIVCSGGKVRVSGGALQHKTWGSFTDLDATPSVSAGNHFLVTNSGATSITNFDDGPNSSNYVQELVLRFADANTTLIHGAGTIRLAGGANFVSTAADVITLVSDASTPTIWYEKSRSVNS